MKKFLKMLFQIFVYFFAIVGFSFISMFFAIRLHLTDSSGRVDAMSDQISDLDKSSFSGDVLGTEKSKKEFSLETLDVRLQQIEAC